MKMKWLKRFVLVQANQATRKFKMGPSVGKLYFYSIKNVLILVRTKSTILSSYLRRCTSFLCIVRKVIRNLEQNPSDVKFRPPLLH